MSSKECEGEKGYTPNLFGVKQKGRPRKVKKKVEENFGIKDTSK